MANLSSAWGKLKDFRDNRRAAGRAAGWYPLAMLSIVVVLWIEVVNTYIVSWVTPYLGFLGIYAGYGALFVSLLVLFWLVKHYASKQTGL